MLESSRLGLLRVKNENGTERDDVSFYRISSCPPKRAIGKRRGFLIIRQGCEKTRRLEPFFAEELKPGTPHRAKNGGCKLAAPGWNSATRLALEKLIRKGAGKRLPAVFDFDNTILHGDIHEATLGMLVLSGRLTSARLPAQFAPTFHSARGKIDLQSCADIVEYYNQLLAPTMHGENDPSPKTTGYAWAIEALGGLRLSEVVEATREVCELARSNKHDFITVTPGRTVLPVPRFYPEMLELLAELIRHEFDIWIISASNV